MTVIKSEYNRNYYRKKPFDSQRNRNRLRELLSHKREGRLLEIGCGKGRFLSLARNHFKVEGVDISKYAIAFAKRIFGKRVTRENIEVADLRQDYYDVIAAFNVLEHLKRPRKAIDNIFQALTPGGIVIGSVPLNAGIAGKVHTTLANFFDRTHRSTYPPQQWLAAFEASGLRNIEFFGEIMLGEHLNLYVRHMIWKWISFNLMFVCQK